MSSCCKGRQVSALHKKTCPLAAQAERPSYCTRRHVVLLHTKTCLLTCLRAQQEDTSSCAARRRVVVCGKKTCLLVHVFLFAQQEDLSMSSCCTGRLVFLCNEKSNKKTCLHVQQNIHWRAKKTCLLVQVFLFVQGEDMSSCCTSCTGRHVQQEDMSSC